MTAQHQQFNPGDVIFEEGQHGEAMYIITQGKVKIVREHDRAAHLIAELSDGEFFGEMSIFTDEPRTATAIASESTIVLKYNAEEITELVESRPFIAARIIHRLASRLQETTNQLMQLRQSSPGQ